MVFMASFFLSPCSRIYRTNLLLNPNFGGKCLNEGWPIVQIWLILLNNKDPFVRTRMSLCLVLLLPSETIPKKKQQSRQVQATHTPSFPQHTGWCAAWPSSPSTPSTVSTIAAATACGVADLAAIMHELCWTPIWVDSDQSYCIPDKPKA